MYKLFIYVVLVMSSAQLYAAADDDLLALAQKYAGVHITAACEADSDGGYTPGIMQNATQFHNPHIVETKFGTIDCTPIRKYLPVGESLTTDWSEDIYIPMRKTSPELEAEYSADCDTLFNGITSATWPYRRDELYSKTRYLSENQKIILFNHAIFFDDYYALSHHITQHGMPQLNEIDCPQSLQVANLLCGQKGVTVDVLNKWFGLSIFERPWDHMRSFLALFLHYGADVNASDEHGHSPLFRCCWRFNSSGSDIALLNWLLKAGAKPDQTNKKGETLIECAQRWISDPVKCGQFIALLTAGKYDTVAQ